jgi:hypothetical protein
MLALYFSGLDFSVSAAIGFVSLFGVSVMDGILMITYYNQARQDTADSVEAMFQAATHRMRPMLMTAWSACIGLLPAAVSTGIGSQVQRPLAAVVVGGFTDRSDYVARGGTRAAHDVFGSGTWFASGCRAKPGKSCLRRIRRSDRDGNYGWIKPPAAALIAASVRVAAPSLMRALSM